MLIALKNNERIVAKYAQRNDHHVCPGCQQKVILKYGRIIIPHFAHTPNSIKCAYSAGETEAHLRAKDFLADYFRSKGYRAELEVPLNTPSGHRVVDVMLWLKHPGGFTPSGFVRGTTTPIAIEVQHASISIEQLEQRVLHYANIGLTQLWLPLRGSKPFAFERYIRQLMLGELWILNPDTYTLRNEFKMDGYQSYLEYSITDLTIKLKTRSYFETRIGRYPACRIATFIET